MNEATHELRRLRGELSGRLVPVHARLLACCRRVEEREMHLCVGDMDGSRHRDDVPPLWTEHLVFCEMIDGASCESYPYNDV